MGEGAGVAQPNSIFVPGREEANQSNDESKSADVGLSLIIWESCERQIEVEPQSSIIQNFQY